MCQWNFKSEIDCPVTLEVKIICGGVSQTTTQTVWPGSFAQPHDMYVDLQGLFCTCDVSTCTIEIRKGGTLVYKSDPPTGLPSVQELICCIPGNPKCVPPNNCCRIFFSCLTREVWLRKPIECH